MANSGGFTPTEKAILEMLSDGRPHSKDEVHGCLPDGMSRTEAIFKHISFMRKKLRAKGLDIVCDVIDRKAHYKFVRLVGEGE